MLTPEEARERCPVMEVDDLAGAIWLPGDGKANPTDLTAGAGQGRPEPGGHHPGAHPGHRDPDRGRGGRPR